MIEREKVEERKRERETDNIFTAKQGIIATPVAPLAGYEREAPKHSFVRNSTVREKHLAEQQLSRDPSSIPSDHSMDR